MVNFKFVAPEERPVCRKQDKDLWGAPAERSVCRKHNTDLRGSSGGATCIRKINSEDEFSLVSLFIALQPPLRHFQ